MTEEQFKNLMVGDRVRRTSVNNPGYVFIGSLGTVSRVYATYLDITWDFQHGRPAQTHCYAYHNNDLIDLVDTVVADTELVETAAKARQNEIGGGPLPADFSAAWSREVSRRLMLNAELKREKWRAEHPVQMDDFDDVLGV